MRSSASHRQDALVGQLQRHLHQDDWAAQLVPQARGGGVSVPTTHCLSPTSRAHQVALCKQLRLASGGLLCHTVGGDGIKAAGAPLKVGLHLCQVCGSAPAQLAQVGERRKSQQTHGSPCLWLCRRRASCRDRTTPEWQRRTLQPGPGPRPASHTPAAQRRRQTRPASARGCSGLRRSALRQPSLSLSEAWPRPVSRIAAAQPAAASSARACARVTTSFTRPRFLVTRWLGGPVRGASLAAFRMLSSA